LVSVNGSFPTNDMKGEGGWRMEKREEKRREEKRKEKRRKKERKSRAEERKVLGTRKSWRS